MQEVRGFLSFAWTGGLCQVNFDSYHKKWYPAPLTPFCITGNCPPKC
jgi:hypothetical protein